MGAIGKCLLDTVNEEEEQNDVVSMDREGEGGEILLDCPSICTAAAGFAALSKEVIAKPAYLKHKEHFDFIQAQKDIEDAKEEWEQVSSDTPPLKYVVRTTSPIKCEEVLSYFQAKDMSEYQKHIKPVEQRTKLRGLVHWVFGPPKLNAALIPERDLVFTMAQCPFDYADSIHIRVLQTIYKTLTGSQCDCPHYGSHWENIGFQGVDPGTDLRGVGFLGLYHLLHLLLNPRTPQLWKDISALSHSESQEFPLCLIGINITRIVLETLRAEALNKECNRASNVFLVTSDFYVGLYLYFCQIWRKEKKSIMDSGYVLKDISALAKKNPSFILKQLQNYCDGQAEIISDSIPCGFSDIGDITMKPSEIP